MEYSPPKLVYELILALFLYWTDGLSVSHTIVIFGNWLNALAPTFNGRFCCRYSNILLKTTKIQLKFISELLNKCGLTEFVLYGGLKAVATSVPLRLKAFDRSPKINIAYLFIIKSMVLATIPTRQMNNTTIYFYKNKI